MALAGKQRPEFRCFRSQPWKSAAGSDSQKPLAIVIVVGLLSRLLRQSSDVSL